MQQLYLSSLRDALYCIFKNQTLQIDGICLNQQNDKEKARQVGRMNTIYSWERCAWVWSGLANGESDFVIQAIKDTVQEIETEF